MAETNVAQGRVFDADGQLVATVGQEIPKDAKGPLVYEDHFATAAAPVPPSADDEPAATVETTEADRTDTGQGSKQHASAKSRSASGE